MAQTRIVTFLGALTSVKRTFADCSYKYHLSAWRSNHRNSLENSLSLGETSDNMSEVESMRAVYTVYFCTASSGASLGWRSIEDSSV